MAEKLVSVSKMEDLLAIFGSFDENIKMIEKAFSVTAVMKDGGVKLTGEEAQLDAAARRTRLRWRSRRSATVSPWPAPATMKRSAS